MFVDVFAAKELGLVGLGGGRDFRDIVEVEVLDACEVVRERLG